MSIASTRAQAVAKILWELKKAGKLGSHSAIADRAGFPPGANGKTVRSILKTVRRGWPQLQWWRAVPDDGQVDAEHQTFLAEEGFATEPGEEDCFVIQSLDETLMVWEEPSEVAE